VTMPGKPRPDINSIPPEAQAMLIKAVHDESFAEATRLLAMKQTPDQVRRFVMSQRELVLDVTRRATEAAIRAWEDAQAEIREMIKATPPDQRPAGFGIALSGPPGVDSPDLKRED